MEKKGIRTDAGDLNREIRKANRMMFSIRNMIRKLADWIGAVQEAWKELETEAAAKPKPVYLGDLLLAKLEVRRNERSDWNRYARTKGSIRDMQKVLDFADYLNRNSILTVSDLNEHLSEAYEQTAVIKTAVKSAERRVNTISGIRKARKDLQETKEVHDQYMKIGWKRRREKFAAEHTVELQKYQKADRFLRKFAPDGGPDEAALTAETAKLEKEIAAKSRKLEAMQGDLTALKEIRYFVKEFMPEIAPDESDAERQPVSIREQLERNRRMLQEKEVQTKDLQNMKTERRPEL